MIAFDHSFDFVSTTLCLIDGVLEMRRTAPPPPPPLPTPSLSLSLSLSLFLLPMPVLIPALLSINLSLVMLIQIGGRLYFPLSVSQ